MRQILQILLLIVFWMPQLSAADIYKYEATGVVDFVFNGGTSFDNQVSVGDTFLMRFTLDTNENQSPDGSSATQTMYRQSYPITLDFDGGSGPIIALTPKSNPPWYGAEQHRVLSGGFRQHGSGNNSDGMNVYIDGVTTTADFVDLIFEFSEFSPPYAFTDMDLWPLPSFDEFDVTVFSMVFNVYGAMPSQTILSGYFESLTAVPRLACSGFYEPMDQYPVAVKKNRVLPLKMELFNDGGVAMTDTVLSSSPILRITHSTDAFVSSIDVSVDALPAGLGMDGNEFVYTDEGFWRFNLKTKNYSAPGTYKVEVISGNEWQYGIDPNCETSFTID